MKQYYSIKAVHPDAILLFRVGDFYETFGEDAIKASGILGITLTRRANGAASYVELAGFPYHAIDTYLPKLVRAGERVAVCEQLEDPKTVKGLVKRGVIELVTPGVALGDNILTNKENTYDFDNYRYYAGPALQCSNVYPVGYAKGFYDGLKAAGETEILSLVRCAWAGSQKYGALTWSGDIHSSFRAMREQLQAGLNMCVAGIPWWTSDIGGFIGGNIQDPYFKELLVRWFAWGAFCPVFRMHGERSPWYEREEEFINGVRQLTSGQDNEVWSFGEDNYEILKKYLFIRERLRPYIRECMRQASETGAPVMRPLFFDFPRDKTAWEVEDAYMFGPDLLVAPVMEEGQREREVYLPGGCRWTDANTKEVYEGGRRVTVPAPLDIIPVFVREGRTYSIYE